MDLLAHCDVFVSLHRSEGMGLTPIEAGLCGLPVVYTNYGGGSTDFLDGVLPGRPIRWSRVGDSSNGGRTLRRRGAVGRAGPGRRGATVAPGHGDGGRGRSGHHVLVDQKQLTENLLTAQVRGGRDRPAPRWPRAVGDATTRPSGSGPASLTRRRRSVEEPPPPPNRFFYVVVASSVAHLPIAAAVAAPPVQPHPHRVAQEEFAVLGKSS